jgi:hypothetical protein
MTDNVHPLRPTESPPLSTVELSLADLPDRLDDTTLAAVEMIARSPLPRLPACDERHFAQCLRMMLAVLPRQQTDDVGGELFVECYRRQLAEWPNEAISYLAAQATGQCRWFPTISECREILQGWRRSDEATARRNQAAALAAKERNQRFAESRPPPPVLQNLTQEEVDMMNPTMVRIGLRCGALVQNPDGSVSPAPEAA